MSKQINISDSKSRSISAAVLVLSQLLYLALAILSVLVLRASLFGVALVMDCRFSSSPIARAILIRAWALFICEITFPFVALIASIAAWNFRSNEAFKKAVFVSLIPLSVVVCYYLLFIWDPYVLH
jgi:hypothetical protein